MARTQTAAKRQAAVPAPKPVAAPSRATKTGGASGGKPGAPLHGAAARPVKGTKPAPAAKSTSNGPGTGSTSGAGKSTAKAPALPKRAPTRAAKHVTKGTKGTKGAKAPARAVRGTKSAGRGAARKSVARKSAAPVVRVVRVKQLDPVAKCGPSTSVEQLFRVDEEANGEATVHLVFFDRHGWYCVHGPRCAAVADVHSHTKTVQRARAGGR